ncbi:MAG: tetratricopeptide repeat protein [Pirellulales bacterium]|nr:tetratricopeptide repeat protein [Pirellulales bacterium]
MTDQAIELYNQGVVLMEKQQNQDAQKAFGAAIELEPTFAEAYNARAVVTALDGQFTEAIQDVDEAIRLKPSSGRFYRTRGLIYREMGDEAQATENLAKSDELTQKDT